ncbi:MAG: DUF4231 domain-containing protein [Symploca sp. SIO2G7]|nr:DUF4231 domain-containing protein [Symploca sp. SIO2G7]
MPDNASLSAKSEPTLSSRQQKYLETAADQQKWFSSKAQTNQNRGNTLGFAMLVTSTLVSGLALINVNEAKKVLGIATGVIGGINTVVIGLDRQHRFREIGNYYRIASEEIKGHIRLFEAELIDFVEFSKRYEGTLKRDLERFKEDTAELAEK